MSVVLNVNGKPYRFELAPDTPLHYVLRNDLALNRPKFGCGLGQCGACTVLVDGEAAQGPMAAAIANAVFDATGIRLRSLPFSSEKLRRRSPRPKATTRLAPSGKQDRVISFRSRILPERR
jgi:xanthine dehydrogenase iron-sulfur cluster and FAD-binding subunit A